MTTFTIVRTSKPFPEDTVLDKIRDFLFGVIDGYRDPDKKSWRRFWRKIKTLEPGEFFVFEITFPRSSPFHRRHMKIESEVFNAQERFEDFEQFRYWVKVGAAWVIWAAGPKGGVVPIPKSISYAKADQDEFERFHVQVMEFLRGPHAADYLWPHLKGPKATEMMDQILTAFDE